MKAIRNILQITPSGARLLDANGRRVQLALPLGTSVVLEFDLRGMPNAFNGTLSTLPIDEYGATEFYFAVDEKPESSDVPALLRITGITVETDSKGHKIFRVAIPNTATPEIVPRLGDRDKAEFWAEIGGINADGVTVFAYSFNVTVLNRVYGGGGEETAANDPAYLKAVEVKAMLPTLTVEQTEAGAIITTTDKNGSQTAEIKGIPGEKGDKGDPGEKGEKGDTPLMEYVGDTGTITALQAGKYYNIPAAVVSLDITSVETSLQEIVLQFTAGDGANISFPATLAWVGEPSFEAGKTYLISIVNNIAVAAEVTA